MLLLLLSQNGIFFQHGQTSIHFTGQVYELVAMCHQASVILSCILYISISLSAMCCPTSVTLSHRLYISKVYIHFLFWSLFNIYSPVIIVGSFQCRIILWALLTTFISQLGVLPSSVWKNGSVIKGSPRMWWRYELVTVPSKWSHCTHMLYCHVVLSCQLWSELPNEASKWNCSQLTVVFYYEQARFCNSVRTTVLLECGSF